MQTYSAIKRTSYNNYKRAAGGHMLIYRYILNMGIYVKHA